MAKNFLSSFYSGIPRPKVDAYQGLLSRAQELALLAMPRFQPGLIDSAKGPLAYVDACTLVVGVREIFAEHCYRIPDRGTMTIIDCGANIGVSTIWFATYYPLARVIAYEADPAIFHALQMNISSLGLDDRVSIHNQAVWTNNQGVRFVCEGGASGRIASTDSGSAGRPTVQVSSQSIVDIVRSCNRIDLLKLDIEGSESEVMLTPGLDLSCVKNLFLEYHSIVGKPQGLPEILAKLKQSDFRVYIKEARVSSSPFMEVSSIEGMDMQLNIYAVRV